MKYKRRRSNVSKYVEKKQKQKKYPSFKCRIIISVFLTAAIFTLAKAGTFKSKSVIGLFKTDSEVYQKITDMQNESFTEDISKKITDFCRNIIGKEKKGSVFAENIKPKEEKEVLSDSDKEIPKSKENEKHESQEEFKVMNPCPGLISSEFGQRVHPLKSEVSFHNGIDIASKEGTEIRACFDGTVTKSEYNEYSGNYIVISHKNGYTSSYSHMSKLYKAKDDVVKKGDVLGLVGSTGQATGPHLHFEIRLNSVPVNPCDYIG